MEFQAQVVNKTEKVFNLKGCEMLDDFLMTHDDCFMKYDDRLSNNWWLAENQLTTANYDFHSIAAMKNLPRIDKFFVSVEST